MNNAIKRIRCDVTLSTGLRVTHRRHQNGSTWALPVAGRNTTNSEWSEYCELIRGGVPTRDDLDPCWTPGDPAPIEPREPGVDWTH